MTRVAEKWLRSSPPRPGARTRLLCFPHAVGGASVYRRWGMTFPDDLEIIAVQTPGREDRLSETPFDRLEPLLDHLAEAAMPFLTGTRFALFGHSLGALAAFEFARLLSGQRLSPVTLFVSGRRAPHLPSAKPPFHLTPDSTLLAELRRLGATPQAVMDDPELRKLILRLMRADYALFETYEYRSGPPLDVPIVAYGGEADPEASAQELEAWRAQTRAGFARYSFPGGHFYIDGALELLTNNIYRRLTSLV
jgi:medium-chain acyl-[acyl-carrier-protein] hydrolase